MILYLEALAAIALSLSLLMAGAWMVQQRTAILAGSIPSGRFRSGLPARQARCGRPRAYHRAQGNGWSQHWW